MRKVLFILSIMILSGCSSFVGNPEPLFVIMQKQPYDSMWKYTYMSSNWIRVDFIESKDIYSIGDTIVKGE